MNDWLFDFSAVRTPDFELEVAVGAMADARDIEDPVERRVGRALLLNWATEGAGFAQNVADVENMSPQERHDLLQRAHRALGLETPDDRREREEREERDRIVWHRPIPECVICGEVARGAGGFPDANTPPARKWHCPDHVHLAEPGDMDPPPVPIGANMQYIPDDAEVEREKRRDERIQREQRERNEQRRLRGIEQRQVREAREREIDEGLLGGPR